MLLNREHVIFLKIHHNDCMLPTDRKLQIDWIAFQTNKKIRRKLYKNFPNLFQIENFLNPISRICLQKILKKWTLKKFLISNFCSFSFKHIAIAVAAAAIGVKRRSTKCWSRFYTQLHYCACFKFFLFIFNTCISISSYKACF